MGISFLLQGMLQQLDLVISFPLDELGSDNSPVLALVNELPLWTGLVKENKVLWAISKWLLLPSPCS